MTLSYELIKHFKRNSCLAVSAISTNDMIHVTDDYRIGIFPLNVNKCDVTNMLLLHGAAEVSSNLRNVLNDRSVENDAWM